MVVRADKIVIQMLKRRDDGALPGKLDGRKAMYVSIKDRPKPTVDEYMNDLGHKRSEYQSVLEQVDAQLDIAAQPRLFSVAEEEVSAYELGEPADEVLDDDPVQDLI